MFFFSNMNRVHLFICFFLYYIDSNDAINYTCDSTSSCGCSTASVDVTARIVGGQIAPDQAWAWTVSLKLSGSHQCGASLIAPEYAITAAHCVDDQTDASQLTILAGTNYRYDTDEPAQERQVLKYVMHPDYKPSTDIHTHDIAVLYFSPLNVSSNSTIRFICLPPSNTDLSPVDSNVIAVGWGTTEEDGHSLSDYLQQVTLQVFSPTSQECKDALIENSTAQICAGVEGGGKDTCQGDSGGPLMSYVNDTWVLVGLTSYGIGCARSGYPGIYTRVSTYISFITDVINNVGVTTVQTTSFVTTTSSPETLINSARNQLVISFEQIFLFLFCLLNIIIN